MSKLFRLLGLPFVAVFLALVLSMGSLGTALAQGCDTSGTVDGSALPTTVLPNQIVTFEAVNMTPGENVSFWFTLPDGRVAGTASPLCCAGADGHVRFAPITLPSSFYQNPGRWALTVEGASSHHQSIIYFCVFTTAQATSTAVPPTATTAAATATTAATAAASPSAVASETAVGTTVATAPAGTATVAPISTTAPVATDTPETLPVAEATPTEISVGMPNTGSGPDVFGFALGFAALMALMLLALGLLARHSARVRR